MLAIVIKLFRFVIFIFSKDYYGYVALPVVQAGGVAVIVDYDLAPLGMINL